MSLPCIKQLTTVNFDKMTNKKNDYLVIHWVAAVSTAKNNADYFQSTYRGASAHYFVDSGVLANCVYQIVSEFNAAWHVGATTYKHPSCRNTNSIGIEICCIKDATGGVIMDPLAIERAAELARSVCQMWNIPRDRVLRHFDVTGKFCPVPFNRDNAAWEAFKDKIFNASNKQANNTDKSSNNQNENNQGKENMAMMQVDTATYEMLVGKATKYDAFAAAGYNTADDVKNKVNQLQQDKANIENDCNSIKSQLDLANQKIAQLQNTTSQPAEIAPTNDVPEEVKAGGKTWVLNGIVRDALGRLNGNYKEKGT